MDYVVAYRSGQPSTEGDFVLRLWKGEEAMKLGATTKTKSNSLKNQEKPDNYERRKEVRKTLSIVLALAMVLAMSAIATPVAAKVVNVKVDVDPNCAGQIGVYNISFNTSASLTEGVHCVCIKFPAGTVVPASGFPVPWFNGDIMINGDPVFGSEVTVTGTEVCFLVPDDYDAGYIEVIFTDDACIINPAAGKYQLEVYTCREPDSTPVKNLDFYTIIPCFSSYVWEWDSSPMFPGIASDFVPPFKACGQNMTNSVFDQALMGGNGGYWEPFALYFYDFPGGCFAPCENVDLYLQLTASPQVPCGFAPCVVSLNLTTNTTATPTAVNVSTTLDWQPCLDLDGIPDKVVLANDLPLTADIGIAWDGMIHFACPGDYTICFTAECTGGAACEPPSCEPGGNILVQRCIDFKVHQWKDAAKITLDEKWNLISLPLVPFDTDLEAMLASVDTFDYYSYFASGKHVVQDNLLSIWNYDAATGDWLVYGNGQSSLTTIEDGKSYWFRLRYPLFTETTYTGLPPNTCGNYSWWVFGTELPEPPAGPKVYSVEAGWNMVGFTSLTDLAANVYLGNWDAMGIPEPVIYGWDHGCFAVQKWSSIAFASGNLVSGQGYWMAFPFAGAVFQVVP